MAVRDGLPKARVSNTHFFLTLSRGDKMRCFAVRPWALYSIAGILPVCGFLYFSASLIFVMRDDVVASVFQRQQTMQQAYEDRIAAMRSQIDRVSSRQLLDQNSLEGKMHDLISRQAKLETRSAIVAALANRIGKTKIKRTSKKSPPPPTRPKRLGNAKHKGKRNARLLSPGDITGSVHNNMSSYAATSRIRSPAVHALGAALSGKPRPSAVKILHDEHAHLDSTTTAVNRLTDQYTKALAANPDLPVELRLGAVTQSLDLIETAQLRRINEFGDSARTQAKKLRSIIASTGLSPNAIKIGKPKARTSAAGGPFIPFKLDPEGSAFERAVLHIQKYVIEADRLRQVITRLPVRRPLSSGTSVSSRFGQRIDPFNGRLANHTGVDFRQHYGAPVLAAAAGRVVKSGYSGGYGKVVEIDHGSGLTSRYAHLSRLNVEVGQWVGSGVVIGKVGSTGRSTGPHLHYEVRLHARPIDPMRFLRAGRKLATH